VASFVLSNVRDNVGFSAAVGAAAAAAL
jgi:hypothetical protein